MNIINKICAWIVKRGYIESGLAGELDAAERNAKAINARIYEIFTMHRSIMKDLYPDKYKEKTEEYSKKLKDE